MTMNTDMRDSLETRNPVPFGIKYDAEYGGYVHAFHQGAVQSVSAYNAKYREYQAGWQASRAVPILLPTLEDINMAWWNANTMSEMFKAALTAQGYVVAE